MTIKMGQTVHLTLFLATVSLVLSHTLQHSCRYKHPCTEIPEEELLLRQEFQEVTSTRRHCIHCCPHSLLGFPADQYHNHSFSINWKFKGKEFPWKRETSTFSLPYHGMQTLESMGTLPGDEGVYICTVTGANGTSVTKNTSLCVNVNEDTHGPPVKSNVSGNATVLPGEKVTFTCSAYTGSRSCLHPQIHNITWTKRAPNGSWVPLTHLRHLHTFHSGYREGSMWSSLNISQVEQAHYGHYRCTVTNHHGALQVVFTLDKGVTGMRLLAGQYRAGLVVVTALVVFLVVASCVWHRCRMVIALYCSRKTAASPPDGFQYDVLVVHGESASRWVWSVLLPMLEDTCGYTCFLPERDMCGGDLMIEVLAEAVSRCRRVVVVVTPCLMANPWAAWAMYHAMQAALSNHARVLALVLKDLKANEDIPDTSGIRGILKLVRKIRVPYSCGWKTVDEPSQEAPHRPQEKAVKQVTKPTKGTKVTNRLALKLMIPGGEETRNVRSRSKSPKNQRLSNMITGINVASRKNLEDDLNKKREAGRNVIYTEEQECGTEHPGTPCSVTPFILPTSGRTRGPTLVESLSECMKVLCTGDQEKIFWQTVRCRLGPPAFHHRLTTSVDDYK